MKRSISIAFAAVLLLATVACQEKERSLTTADYGNKQITGQIVTTGDLGGASAAGIEVRVRGTGISSITDARGNFALGNLPDGDNELRFTRISDGVDAALTIPSSFSGAVVVELSKKGAKSGRHRGVGHPGPEVEGVIKTVSADSITVTDSHKTDVTLAITTTTIIRKGNKTLTAADLKTGDRVHVKSVYDTNGAGSAVEIMLQDDGTEDDDTNELTGKITAVGTTDITVTLADGTSQTIKVDANTVIRKQGQLITLADLQVGDTVELVVTKQTDGSLLARRITVEVPEAEEVELHGTVTAVGTDQLTVHLADGTDVTVKVNSTTQITKDHITIALADITVDSIVEVDGTRIDATTVLAKKIKVESH